MILPPPATAYNLHPFPMDATICTLLIFALIAAVWSYIPAPQPIKVIGWIILAAAFILKFLLPLL